MAKRPVLAALLASPRPQGHSASLLAAFLKPLRSSWDIRFFHLSALTIKPCLGCNRCIQTKTFRCFRRDAFPKLLAAWDQADALVLSAPVYFYGFPAQAKAVIDRCHPLFHDSHWTKHIRRPGYFLANCDAAARSEFKVITSEARAFMNTIAFEYAGDLLVPGMSNRDAKVRLARACLRAQSLGRTLGRKGMTE
jgi:multimeric flavodoxin WrbA